MSPLPTVWVRVQRCPIGASRAHCCNPTTATSASLRALWCFGTIHRSRQCCRYGANISRVATREVHNKDNKIGSIFHLPTSKIPQLPTQVRTAPLSTTLHSYMLRTMPPTYKSFGCPNAVRHYVTCTALNMVVRLVFNNVRKRVVSLQSVLQRDAANIAHRPRFLKDTLQA